jgi:hypothetical protein
MAVFKALHATKIRLAQTALRPKPFLRVPLGPPWFHPRLSPCLRASVVDGISPLI